MSDVKHPGTFALRDSDADSSKNEAKMENSTCTSPKNLVGTRRFCSGCCNLFRKNDVKYGHEGDYSVKNDVPQNSTAEKLVRAHSFRSLPRNCCCNKRHSLSHLENHQRSTSDGCSHPGCLYKCSNQLSFCYQNGEAISRLRESRRLYGLPGDQIALHPAQWPAELEVISQEIRHIRVAPNHPEPFHYPQSHHSQPTSTNKERPHVVYSYTPSTPGYFIKSCSRSRRSNECISNPSTPSSSSSLLFESRFESGNLEKAVQISEYAYELHVRSDLYTNKHNQWFYFMIRNTQAGVRYKFTIVNLLKPNSLYNMGMKPLFYSEMDADKNNIGWTRVGYNICYYHNDSQLNEDEPTSTYSLMFCCEFPHNDDTVYFAHCYPYTYTMLQNYLEQLQGDPDISTICKQRVLCRSLAGNYIYILTITSPGTAFENSKKKVAVITSRVHPGETNSSYMLEGIVNCLTENSSLAKLLREQFIFKIVPMLNPDGVIVGNSRCSLSSRDLNRCYRETLKESYPSVWYTKQLIRRLMVDHDIVMYCDLHGHSRKHNVFAYGCENKRISSKRHQEQLFPLLFQHVAPNHFSFNSTRFKVLKNKEGTGRVVVWQLGVLNSFTIEASFCGSSLGKKAGYHFNSCDFQAIGEYFCKALLEYSSCDTSNVAIFFNPRIKCEQSCCRG